MLEPRPRPETTPALRHGVARLRQHAAARPLAAMPAQERWAVLPAWSRRRVSARLAPAWRHGGQWPPREHNLRTKSRLVRRKGPGASVHMVWQIGPYCTRPPEVSGLSNIGDARVGVCARRNFWLDRSPKCLTVRNAAVKWDARWSQATTHTHLVDAARRRCRACRRRCRAPPSSMRVAVVDAARRSGTLRRARMLHAAVATTGDSR